MTSNAGDKFPDRNLGAAEKWGRTIEDRIAELETSGVTPGKATNDAQVAALAQIIADEWTSQLQEELSDFEGSVTWAPYPPTSDVDSDDPEDPEIMPEPDLEDEDYGPEPSLIFQDEIAIPTPTGEGTILDVDQFLGTYYVLIENPDDSRVIQTYEPGSDVWGEPFVLEDQDNPFKTQIYNGLLYVLFQGAGSPPGWGVYTLDGETEGFYPLDSNSSANSLFVNDKYIVIGDGLQVQILTGNTTTGFSQVGGTPHETELPVVGVAGADDPDVLYVLMSDDSDDSSRLDRVEVVGDEVFFTPSLNFDVGPAHGLAADETFVYIRRGDGVENRDTISAFGHDLGFPFAVSEDTPGRPTFTSASSPESILVGSAGEFHVLRVVYEDAIGGSSPDPDPFPTPDLEPPGAVVEPSPVYSSWKEVDEDGNVQGEWQFVDGYWSPRPSGTGSIAVGAITVDKIDPVVVDVIDGAAEDATEALQAAQEAEATAAAAEQAALDAVGLAGSKGKVIFQADPPTGEDASESNLWIRTSDNAPHTWNGTEWVKVTDQAALDAAADAAQAAQDAADALDAANTAFDNANLALQAANGKNTVYRGTGTPPAPEGGFREGDTWFDTSGGDTTIKVWDGSAWVTQEVGTESLAVGAITAESGIIASLDAGTISTGILNAGRIGAQSIESDKIAANAITAVKIATNAVTAEKIEAEAVTTNKIAAQAIIGEKIAANTIGAEKIQTETLGADQGFINVLNSSTIVGAIIKTAASGKRVELDSENGMRIFGQRGAPIFDIPLSGLSGAVVLSNRIYMSSSRSNVISIYNMIGELEDTWEVGDVSSIGTDGVYLFVSTENGVYPTVRVFSTSGSLIRSFNYGGSEYGHNMTVTGSYVYLWDTWSSTNRVVRLSKTGTGAVTRDMPYRFDLKANPDGTVIFAYRSEAGGQGWEQRSALLSSVIRSGTPSDPVPSLFANGIFYGKKGGNYYVWDASTQEEIAEWPGGSSTTISWFLWDDDLYVPEDLSGLRGFWMGNAPIQIAQLQTGNGVLEVLSPRLKGAVDADSIRAEYIGPQFRGAGSYPSLRVGPAILEAGANLFPDYEEMVRSIPIPRNGVEAHAEDSNSAAIKWKKWFSEWVQMRDVFYVPNKADLNGLLSDTPDGTEVYTGSGSTLEKLVRKGGVWVPVWPYGQVEQLDLSPWLNSGYSGSFAAYRDGRHIEIVGNLTGTFGTGTTNFTSAIPAAWRPPGNRFAGAYLAGGYPGNAFARSDGTIAVAQQSGASRAAAQFTIAFMDVS